MRYLIAALALTACAPAAPAQPDLTTDRTRLSRMTYHCLPSGEVIVRFTLPDGVEEGPTGERCDYERWTRNERAYGPVTSRERMPDYEEWLRRNRPEA